MERSSLPEADKPPSNVTALWGATWRNSLRLARNSASLVSALVIPGMFMLAFWGVFGHAAGRSGFDYALYLMAASMFQAVMFAAGGSAMALAVDVESGLLGRMRAMPIHAMVTIGGRMLTDLLRSVASLCAVIMLGLLCGAQPANWMRLAGAFLVALGMGEALVLVFRGTCLRARHPVQTAGLIQALEMPLLMLSTAFIPLSTLPDWLEPVVAHLPFSPMIDTNRALLTGAPLGTSVWETAAWLTSGLVLGSWWVSQEFWRRK